MVIDGNRELYEEEARKRMNFFFELYEGKKSPSPWYLRWYDDKHIKRKEWIQNYLDLLLSKDKVFVDIGCGTGYFPIMNASKTKKAIGIDLSEEYLKYARKNAEAWKATNCTFVRSDVGSLELVEEEVVVLCSQVLEHIEEEMTALSKLSALGSTLVITVPAMIPSFEKVRKLVWPETDPSGHYRNYTLPLFKERLECSGWRINKIEEIAKGPLSFNWIIGAVCESKE